MFAAAVQSECEAGVGGKAALVKFVEDYDSHPGQSRVGDEPGGEHAFRNDFDACSGPNPAVVACRPADGLPRLFGQQRSHASCRCSSCYPSGLKHDNTLVTQPRLVEQTQWNDGCLACARLRYQNRVTDDCQRAPQFFDHFFNREVGRLQFHRHASWRVALLGVGSSADVCASC